MISKTQLLRWKHLGVVNLLLAIAMLLALFPVSAVAEQYQLVPNTKLRVKAIQWNPAKGEYIQWDAISGEFTVSEDGTVFLPLLGTLPVSKLDSAQLADDIAKRLKTKISLISAPDVSVEIIDYPPVYVVGFVANPGEYKFRPGMTVLQAFALGGGLYRQPAGAATNDQISLLSELQSVQTDILRVKARIARLQAELSEAKSVQFPSELIESASNSLAANILSQEQVIFASREKAHERQLKTFAELHDLYTAEIKNLEEKLKSQENIMKRAQDELGRIGKLVDQGILTVSRKSELERQISDARSGYLDLETAMMRARQSLAETTRNSLGLHDQRQTSAATELQEAQTNLERLRGRQDTLQRLLTIGGGQQQAAPGKDPITAFKIIRRVNGQVSETEASGSTVLLPGDVVDVSLRPVN